MKAKREPTTARTTSPEAWPAKAFADFFEKVMLNQQSRHTDEQTDG
jgi:hypothetical protein